MNPFFAIFAATDFGMAAWDFAIAAGEHGPDAAFSIACGVFVTVVGLWMVRLAIR